MRDCRNHFWDLSFPFETSDDSISDCTTPKWSSKSWAENSGFTQGKTAARKVQSGFVPTTALTHGSMPSHTLVTGSKAWEQSTFWWPCNTYSKCMLENLDPDLSSVPPHAQPAQVSGSQGGLESTPPSCPLTFTWPSHGMWTHKCFHAHIQKKYNFSFLS